MRLGYFLLMFCLFYLSACQFPIPAMVFAGGKEAGLVDGLLTSAKFNAIIDMDIDSEGNVFVIDGGNIRKITPSGEVSTIASTRQWIEDAGIQHPRDRIAGFAYLGIDSKNNLFITHTTCIRKLEKQGEEYIASTFVGTCYDQRSNAEVGIENAYEYAHYDAELTAAPEHGFLGGMAIDSEDNIYVTNSVMLKISPDKQVTVLRNQNQDLLGTAMGDMKMGPDQHIYAKPISLSQEPYSNILKFNTQQPSIEAFQISAPHNPWFHSFTLNTQGYVYILAGGPGYMADPGENNGYFLQRISPDGKEVKTWPMPVGISLENAVLDEQRRVIYTGSRRGNQIFKIPLPDGA